MTVVKAIHGESIGKRAEEFALAMRNKNGAYFSIAVLEKYMLRCFKHFTADLQIVYDEWVKRPGDATMAITLPRIGHSVHADVTENIIDHVEAKRYEMLEKKVADMTKEIVERNMNVLSWKRSGGGDNPGNRKQDRRINVANIPNDDKGKRLCVAFAQSRGCKAGEGCKFSHERKIGAKELEKVFEK